MTNYSDITHFTFEFDDNRYNIYLKQNQCSLIFYSIIIMIIANQQIYTMKDFLYNRTKNNH